MLRRVCKRRRRPFHPKNTHRDSACVVRVKNLAELEQRISQARGKPVMLDFYADWCGPCRMLTPVLDQVAQDVKGKASVVKVDIDQAQKVTEDLQITSVPTLILFKEGKEVKRIIGLRDADFIKGFVLAIC